MYRSVKRYMANTTPNISESPLNTGEKEGVVLFNTTPTLPLTLPPTPTLRA